METAVKTYLEKIEIAAAQSYKNLTLFPLISRRMTLQDYLLLDEALTQNLIEIQEVDQGGSVPELKVLNKSSRMVLILDGEELVGAKQNRVVNTTILIKGQSATTIPVSCVEQGRWSYASKSFYSQERMMSGDLRAKKAAQVQFSVRNTGRFHSDQMEIWDEIRQKAVRREAESPSMAMASIHEKERPTLRSYTEHFRLVDSQTGALFLINGQIVGLDSFGNPETFSKVFHKLLESYALDAIDWAEREEKKRKETPDRFIESAVSAQMETHPSVALGEDVRLESDKVVGFALTLGDQVLHLSVFARVDQAKQEGYHPQMERPSRRRINRV